MMSLVEEVQIILFVLINESGQKIRYNVTKGNPLPLIYLHFFFDVLSLDVACKRWQFIKRVFKNSFIIVRTD